MSKKSITKNNKVNVQNKLNKQLKIYSLLINIFSLSLSVLHSTKLHFSAQSVYQAMSAPHQTMGWSSVYTLHTEHCTLTAHWTYIESCTHHIENYSLHTELYTLSTVKRISLHIRLTVVEALYDPDQITPAPWWMIKHPDITDQPGRRVLVHDNWSIELFILLLIHIIIWLRWTGSESPSITTTNSRLASDKAVSSTVTLTLTLTLYNRSSNTKITTLT